MKTRFLSILLVAVFTVSLSLVAGCTDYTKTAYRTVATASITYDAIMNAAGDAYRAGALSDDQKDQIIVYGKAAEGAIGIARSALEAYVVAGETDGPLKDKLIDALANLAGKLGTLQEYGSQVLGAFNPEPEV